MLTLGCIAVSSWIPPPHSVTSESPWSSHPHPLASHTSDSSGLQPLVLLLVLLTLTMTLVLVILHPRDYSQTYIPKEDLSSALRACISNELFSIYPSVSQRYPSSACPSQNASFFSSTLLWDSPSQSGALSILFIGVSSGNFTLALPP